MSKVMQLKEMSELARQKHKDLSNQYKFLDSQEILHKLEGQGFKHEGTSFAGVRKAEKAGFQKHIMVFDTGKLIDDDNRVRLLVTNAYDGSHSLKFNLGIYRAICANGLVAGEHIFSDRIIHKGEDVEEELMRIVAGMGDKVEDLVDAVQLLQGRKFDEALAASYISDCVTYRHGGEQVKFTIDDFHAKRNKDRDEHMYNLFNVAQETIIKGDYYYQSGEKTRKARPIKSIGSNIDNNQFMFDRILELAA